MCMRVTVIVSISTAGTARAGIAAVSPFTAELVGAESMAGTTGATAPMSVVIVVIATTTANGSASKPGQAAPTAVLRCVGTPQPKEMKFVVAPAAKEVWTPAPTQQRQEVA